MAWYKVQQPPSTVLHLLNELSQLQCHDDSIETLTLVLLLLLAGYGSSSR